MILITGASGNVGSEVLKQAAAAGLKLRAAYQSAGKAARAPAGVETVLMDYVDADTRRRTPDAAWINRRSTGSTHALVIPRVRLAARGGISQKPSRSRRRARA
jgi:nucleoside-diphosphate-sugar epimerase